MPTTSVRRILETAKGVVDRLTSNAPDDLDLKTSRVLLLREFAMNYRALGDVATALDFAQASVKGAREIVNSQANGASTQILAFSLITLGRVQTAGGNLDAARTAFDEAINIGKEIRLTAPSDTSAAQIEAQALISVSDLEVMGGDTIKALKAAGASVSYARSLSNSQSSNTTWRVLLADGLERSGNISGGITTAWTIPTRLNSALPVDQAGIDYAAALASFEESSKIVHALVGQDPTNTDLRARLDTILIRIGDLNLARAAFADALIAHKEALSISSDLLSADSGNVEWKRRVEVSYQKLNSVYSAQGDFDAALLAEQQSLEIATRLSDLDRENLRWRRDLCSRYRSLGMTQRDKGDKIDALESFSKALAECRETASRYASDPAVRVELAFSLYQASKGRSADDAAPLLREALSILEDLNRVGAIPKANENWAPFIRDEIAKLGNIDVSK